VLLYHVLALNWAPLQAGVYLQPAANAIENLLIFSPLHVVWLGIEAVWFFFVLSGFVLTKAATRPGFSWPAYYPSRLVRLYGPVLFAILFAWLTYVLIPHVVEPGDAPAIASLPSAYPFADMLRDATLLGGTSTSIGVLWSLQWEVVFSLALPAYLILVRRFPIPATVIAVAACLVGWTVNDQVTSYLPMFFFGALLAQYWEPVCRAFSFLGRGRWTSHVAGVALVVLGVCGLTSYFLLGTWLGGLGAPTRAVTVPLALAGIVLLIITGVNWTPLSLVLSTRVMVFLGTISFSLYLIHRPVMIACAFLFGIGMIPAIATIVASMAVAVGFYFALERPMHRLSRRIARSISEETTADAQRGHSPTAQP
jgi:peptidoglycan/LPS O-acetylase OafA/YrhL